MFERVLIVNRGEIAVRIARTLRQMGIRSVVVASIPDRRSLAVRSADDWVLLEGYSASESYLDMDAVIAAAKEKGCQAIHPGYGFLAERPDFAERCAAEGITFIGPPPEVLRGLGDKSAARKLAMASGVPVVPGWDGDDDPETLAREAEGIGYPVMLKARGGGGGRGMREVFAPGELPEAIESARREALAAFGDGGLLIEKLVTEAHHIEVQVLGDTHGNVIHLGERDCSVQRRHQKLIEESPSPVVDDALRAELTGAALKLARAVNYVNAGTFEFLVGPPGQDGRRPFYFLEVNPRLQVEHPVTEMVTGLDIVELQLRIAAGEELPMRQEDVRFEGHAIEFRMNAENPWDEFRPGFGRIQVLHGDGARFDSGFEAGDTVPSHYDSLLGKRLFTGDTRGQAIDRAAASLRSDDLIGVRTNLGLLRAVALHETFRAGDATIDWLERELDTLRQRALRPPAEFAAAAVAFTAGHGGWIGAGAARVWLDDGTQTLAADVRRDVVEVSGERIPFEAWRDGATAHVTIGGHSELALGVESESLPHVWLGNGAIYLVPPPPVPRRAAAASVGSTAITAPLAGTIAAVRVSEGDPVAAGQPLVMLEAMKMEHRIAANADGTVKFVHVKAGDVVREGDVLVEVG